MAAMSELETGGSSSGGAGEEEEEEEGEEQEGRRSKATLKHSSRALNWRRGE
jgi:hypothetical protein